MRTFPSLLVAALVACNQAPTEPASTGESERQLKRFAWAHKQSVEQVKRKLQTLTHCNVYSELDIINLTREYIRQEFDLETALNMTSGVCENMAKMDNELSAATELEHAFWKDISDIQQRGRSTTSAVRGSVERAAQYCGSNRFEAAKLVLSLVKESGSAEGAVESYRKICAIEKDMQIQREYGKR